MRNHWRRRVIDAAGLTQYPPGPGLARLTRQQVYVTSPGSDNIGEILRSMGVDFEPFNGELEDCAILFVNCQTADRIRPADLARFVRTGGCVYASDHADTLIAKAFPTKFLFGGHQGVAGRVRVNVVDRELKEYMGDTLDIDFNVGSWALLLGCRGQVLLRAAGLGRYPMMPIMAYAEYGKGAIFFTCFHNKAQTSEQEKRLLQLLVLKQIGTNSRQSIEQAGRALGIRVEEMRTGLRPG